MMNLIYKARITLLTFVMAYMLFCNDDNILIIHLTMRNCDKFVARY